MRRVLLSAIVAAFAATSLAGSVFLTGHDPDFHASLGGNLVGARRINQVAISYVMDPGFNTFVAGGATKFLFVESNISVPSGHTVGKNGIIASGYAEGSDFDHVDASGLNAGLNLLGSVYGGIVVASDFGGILTQAELDILNARKGDIIDFLNGGGGLYAMSESNSGAHLTPGGGHYGFVPIVTTSLNLDQTESGNTVTAFGASLGLTNSDVNGNASHAIFTNDAFDVVDIDPAGHVLSVAGRALVPEPSTMLVLGGSLFALLLKRRRS